MILSPASLTLPERVGACRELPGRGSPTGRRGARSVLRVCPMLPPSRLGFRPHSVLRRRGPLLRADILSGRPETHAVPWRDLARSCFPPPAGWIAHHVATPNLLSGRAYTALPVSTNDDGADMHRRALTDTAAAATTSRKQHQVRIPLLSTRRGTFTSSTELALESLSKPVEKEHHSINDFTKLVNSQSHAFHWIHTDVLFLSRRLCIPPGVKGRTSSARRGPDIGAC